MSENIRLGGLWSKTTPTGKELWEGTFKVNELTEAMQTVGAGGEVQITIWRNRPEDKHTERSPDASLVMGETWKKGGAEASTPGASSSKLGLDEIPF